MLRAVNDGICDRDNDAAMGMLDVVIDKTNIE
jgi:hypothetical protein